MNSEEDREDDFASFLANEVFWDFEIWGLRYSMHKGMMLTTQDWHHI